MKNEALNCVFRRFVIIILLVSLLTGLGVYGSYVKYCNDNNVIELVVDGVTYICNSYTKGYDLRGKLSYLSIQSENSDFIINLSENSVVEIKEEEKEVSFTQWIKLNDVLYR